MNEELMNDAVFDCIVEGRQLSFVDTLQSACLRFGNETNYLMEELGKKAKAIAAAMEIPPSLLGKQG